MAQKNGKVKRVSTKQSVLVLGTAQGKQTFDSSRMSGAARRQVRASFKKASKAS